MTESSTTCDSIQNLEKRLFGCTIDNLRESLETSEGTYCIEYNFTPLFNSLPKSKKF